jgi:hypothetical protein
MPINVFEEDNLIAHCSAVIIVPDTALAQAGHIQCIASGQTGQSKHEFHALSQMALMQVEDHELSPTTIQGKLRIITEDNTVELKNGLLICRLTAGELAVCQNTDRPVRKYLEAAHRFCTRWVRLDI